MTDNTQKIEIEPKECRNCNGSGDLISIEGQWLGYCSTCCGTGDENFQYNLDNRTPNDTKN